MHLVSVCMTTVVAFKEVPLLPYQCIHINLLSTSMEEVLKELTAALGFGLPWQVVTMNHSLLRVDLKYL